MAEIQDFNKELDSLIKKLDSLEGQQAVESELKQAVSDFPVEIPVKESDYYSHINAQLVKMIISHYKEGRERVGLWRFYKNLSEDQLDIDHYEDKPSLALFDKLVRIYFYSDPLDDLTCIFIPINLQESIKQYLRWIKNYFYDANYPTSLLWLYALDSSLEDFFPEELIFLGQCKEEKRPNILLPDFNFDESRLFKRYSAREGHFSFLQGKAANYEFKQIFDNLRDEYEDRCLSRSGRQQEDSKAEWEKFTEVLAFGVSDQYEHGCISFSDLRNSTTFLNAFGKQFFRNKIQQPFFKMTKLISSEYKGRIDKFMGDNVMCVFLQSEEYKQSEDKDIDSILDNFCSIFKLCRVLLDLLRKYDLLETQLGLRSGVSYGKEILRSNLGNEIVRDFTVTGETVNFAARLEHFNIHELIVHNQQYFEETIRRYPEISSLAAILPKQQHFSPETRRIIQRYTLYQNIISNLEKLEKVRFDIRCNDGFYIKLKEHFAKKGYKILNPDTAGIYGYEEYRIKEHSFRFYFSFFNPKGFSCHEKIWILPLALNTLLNFDIQSIF